MANRSTQDTHSESKAQLVAFRKAGCEPDEKRFQIAVQTVAKAQPSEKGEQRLPDRGGKDDDA